MDPPEDRKMAGQSTPKPDPVGSTVARMTSNVVDLLDDSDPDEVAWVGCISKFTPSSAVARMPSTAKRTVESITIDSSDDDDVSMVTRSGKRRRHGDMSKLKSGDGDEDVVVVVAPSSSKPPPREDKKRTPKIALQPIEQVLDVFPDVQLDYAQKLLQDNNNNPTAVTSIIAENGNNYPKEPTKEPPATGGQKKPPPGTFVKRSTNNNPTYDFYSESAFTPTPDYMQACLAQLVQDFPFLTVQGCKALATAKKHHYAIIHRAVCDAMSGKGSAATRREVDAEISQYRILRDALSGNATVSDGQKRCLATAFGLTMNHLTKRSFRSNPKRRSSFTPPRATVTTPDDPVFIEELKFVEQKLQDWMTQVEAHICRRKQRELSIKEGTAVECPCCCEKVAMEEMVHCRQEGHLFCQDCLSMYTENQIFGNGTFGTHPKTKEPALELLCFSADRCTSGFDRKFLIKALTASTLDKYDELQFQVSVNKADLRKEMCTCPKCHFTAAVAETQNIFQCPVEDCGFESCRHCGEKSHIPLRCEEVEKEHEQNLRTRVEEAAAAAAIRHCPKCSKAIMKDGTGGCNKITCACGCLFCYLCKKQVKDYSHFCQVPHCSHQDRSQCKKCPLWTGGTAQDDENAAREAALAEAAKVQEETKKQAEEQSKAVAADPFVTFSERKLALKPAEGVQIDVESILRAPAGKP